MRRTFSSSKTIDGFWSCTTHRSCPIRRKPYEPWVSSRAKLTDSSGAGNEHILYFDLPIWEGIGVHLGKVETCLGTDKFLPLRSDVPVVGMQEAAESVPVSTIPSIQNLTMNIGNICHWRFSL